VWLKRNHATNNKADRENDINNPKVKGKKEIHEKFVYPVWLKQPTLGERAALRSTKSNKQFTQEISIGLQELVFHPNSTQVPNLILWPRDLI
jgi:ribosomal protein L31